MKQLTATNLYDVLNWIETTQHHKAKILPENDKTKFFVLEGFHDRLRIPALIHRQTAGLVESAPDKFDTRMFRATKIGKRRLRYWRSRDKELFQ